MIPDQPPRRPMLITRSSADDEPMGVRKINDDVSGTITLLPDGTVHSYDRNFIGTVFGLSPNQLLGKNIDELIPSFHDDMAFLKQWDVNGNLLCIGSTEHDEAVKPSNTGIVEGSYFGTGRHIDGTELDIVYQVQRVLDGQDDIFVVLLSLDGDEPDFGSLTATSVSSLTDDVSMLSLSSLSFDDHDDQSVVEDFVAGTYSEQYTTLEEIGRGGFGCVRLARRTSDGLPAVTKFIRKSSVNEERLVVVVEDGGFTDKTVPLEVSLLQRLDHANIIKVADVFENEHFFQMVMEKHGCAIDLFDFIEAHSSDEPLASYIFRQVASAVSYLHRSNVVHRDIKDENVILDRRFHVKLVDFGSAAVMSDDRLFSTFCGTVEFCSPEVLLGHRYRGPELDVWSLGVTLYTLVFGENPFSSVDEIIGAALRPPFDVSPDLGRLVCRMLQRDPVQRCTLPEVEGNPWLKQEVDIERYRFDDVISEVFLRSS